MIIKRQRDFRHGLFRAAVLVLPVLAALGCSSAQSGHAPGVAGGQTLTPGVTNYPIAYVKRPVPKKDIDARDLITSVTGGDLYVRTQASAGGIETNVTQKITTGKGDVRDLDVSPDGTRLVFSLRLPLDPNRGNTDPKQPNWHIYEYDAAKQTVTQLTNDNITAGHDVGARYLPDGRIVFASSRQVGTQAILLDEGRPQYSGVTDNRQQVIFLLHVMNADGTGIHQITFNTNHDFAPSVLNNGQIVFSRWEVTNGTDQISLYRVNPDGTGLELFYGANSHATGANAAGTNDTVVQFLNARTRPDGKLIAIDRPFAGTQLGGDAVLIDTEHFVEITQPSPATGPAGTAQTSATTLGLTTDPDLPSLGGRIASAYPLYDGSNRMLVSWSPCLVQVTATTTAVCTASNTAGATVTLAPPEYTIWIYDFDAGTLSPVLSAATNLETVDPVIMQARKPAPTFIPDGTPTAAAQQNLVSANLGVLDISSVYDVDGVDTATPNIATVADPGKAGYYQRPYRFIRIVKAVEIPGRTVRKIDNSAFGPAGMGMREILGYAPIQPDGSVRVAVPANVPFTIDILDRNARRVTARHTSWLQVKPGETKACNGCHSTVNKTSHGRQGLTPAVNAGAPTTGQPFPNTNPGLFANAGETMAQLLARVSCASGSTLPCSQVLSADVVYSPVWTTGTTVPAGQTDAAFSYLYGTAAGLSESPPTNTNCTPWSAPCRVTIHYANAATAKPLFLQTVWSLDRPTPTALVNGVAVPSTCITCHTTIGANNTLMVPQGQLDLTGGASNVDPTVVNSYEQLLFPHNEQTLNMGVLQDVPGPVVLAPPMAAGSAAQSTAFLRMFDGSFHDPVLDHTGFLTPAELRLISEWLDIGGQYYNDPFVAPVAN
jgi:Tol biopolymer transport system component